MDDLTKRLLFYDDLSPEEQRDTREALAEALQGEDAALARALRRWQGARHHVGERFRRDLPERRLLVLYALGTDSATAGLLTEAEQRELKAARSQIEQALREHPALEDIIEEIRREREAFEGAWTEHAQAALADAERSRAERSSASGESRSRRAADRPPSDRSAPASGAEGAPKHRSVPSKSTAYRAQRWGWRVAGVVALVAFAAVLFFVFQRNQHTVTVTAEGPDPRIVELADGSTVRLMPGATLAYVDPEADATLDRRATLKAGRAFFDIVPSQKGFVVETSTARLTVLGTRFGVTAEERLTHVVLAFGRVALASRAATGQPVMLRPGQESRVAGGARPVTPTVVEDLSEALAWTGLFVFRSTPAEDIARQLSAHYGASVKVAPSLQQEEVTGTFDRSRPLDETLRTIAAALDARLEATPDGYALVPDDA